VLPRKSLMNGDRTGLGGFFEAILAVMIVTSGFTVLMVSFNLVQGDEAPDSGGKAQEHLRAICQRLLGDERLFQQPYVLLLGNSFLWSDVVEVEMSAFKDYSFTLIVDPISPHSILLAQNGFTTTPGEVICMRIPVDVQMTPSTVHVGILEVRVSV
jgi:hypothetical protein